MRNAPRENRHRGRQERKRPVCKRERRPKSPDQPCYLAGKIERGFMRYEGENVCKGMMRNKESNAQV